MDLDELKTHWEKMSDEIEKQKVLTDKLIIDMTQEKYNNKLNKISIPETIGTVICFGFAMLILINFYKLNTWYLVASGIFSISFCIVLPILSLKSIYNLKQIEISKATYKDTLATFLRRKKHFALIQKIGFYFSFLFLIVSLPVISKLMSNEDIFLESKVWLWYLPLGIIFLYLFSKWIYKYYFKSTLAAENLLKDLENEKNK